MSAKKRMELRRWAKRLRETGNLPVERRSDEQDLDRFLAFDNAGGGSAGAARSQARRRAACEACHV